MNKKIEWHDFAHDEPPLLDEFYIVEDTGGVAYIDKWVHRPFENYYGNIIENTWRGTHRGYVERWASIDGISLREFVELTEN
jgi:hypothetical protein